MKNFLSIIIVIFSSSCSGQVDLNYHELNWIALSDNDSYFVEETKDSISINQGDTLKVELIGVLNNGVFQRRSFPEDFNQICGESALLNLDEICGIATLDATLLFKTKWPSIEETFSNGLHISVNLSDSISLEEIESLIASLNKKDQVKSCKYKSREDANSEFEDLDSTIKYFMGELEFENSLEIIIEIDYLNELNTISDQLKDDYRISDVYFNEELLGSMKINENEEVILRIKT